MKLGQYIKHIYTTRDYISTMFIIYVYLSFLNESFKNGGKIWYVLFFYFKNDRGIAVVELCRKTST